MTREEHEGYIIEYVSLGSAIKVTAIDTMTMREVSIVGSPRVSQQQLADLAIRKLQYVLERDGDA